MMKSIEIVLIVIGIVLTVSLVTKPKVNNDLSEVINSSYDIIEWIEHDVESGYLDNSRANTYIYNLEQMIKEIK